MRLTLFTFFTFLCLALGAQEDKDYLLFEVKSHKDAVNTISFNKDGTLLASGGEDKTIYVHALQEQEEVAEWDDHYFPVKVLKYLDDDHIMFTSGSALKIIDQQGKLVHTYPETNTHIRDFTISGNSKYISAGTYYKKVKVWDFVTGEEMYELEGHDKSVLAVGLGPKGRYLATGSLDQTMKVWDMKDGSMIHSMHGHGDNIFAVHFHPQGGYFVSASGDNYLRLWSIEAGRTVKVYSGHDRAVVDAEFSPDGHFIVSAGYDNTIRVWETKSGDEIYTFASHKDPVTDIAISPDGKYMASASEDETVLVWKFLPFLVVDHKMPNALYERMEQEAIFEPKRNDERRSDYQERMEKAEKRKEAIGWELYKEYVSGLGDLKF